MMKRLRFFILIAFILSLFGITIGDASFVINSLDTFSSETGTVVSSTPVCYNKSTNVYYTKLETALDEASSGQTVNVIPETNPTITRNCEVKNGVTLNLPHNITEMTYSASLSLTADNSYTDAKKAGIATLTIYKSGTKYLVWTGTYGYNNVKVNAKCTNHLLESKYHTVEFEASSLTQRISLSLTSQVIYDGNKTYNVSKSQTFNSSLSIEGYKTYSYEKKNILGNTVIEKGKDCLNGTKDSDKDNYKWSYSLTYGYTLTTAIDSLSYNNNTYYLGYSPSFEWTNGNTSSVISNSNLGSFSTDDKLTINTFEDSSNYSNTAIYVTTALNGGCYSNVTISDGIKLTNNGTIYVGGSLAGGTASIGKYTGQTYGPYSQITLGKNAKIESNGEIYCYGYIKESSSDNGSSLVTNSGAKTYVPFVVRDYRGGGITVSCARHDQKSKKCFPFNEYEVRNITCQATIKYGSSLTGWGNLYAGNHQNSTSMEMIGNSSSSFISLSNSSSYVSAKFDETKDVCNLDVYNGCSFNSMSLSLSMVGIETTVNSESFNFSVSYRYQISLLKSDDQSSATYTVSSQSFQFLPGSSLTVGEGCSLSATSLIFYNSWPEEIKNYYSGYSTYGNTAAYLVNNGSVSASTITGLVKSNIIGATLKFSTNSSTTYQVKKGSSPNAWEQIWILAGTSSCISEWSEITNTTTFYTYSNGVFDTSNLNTSVKAGTYTSVKDSNGVYGFKA